MSGTIVYSGSSTGKVVITASQSKAGNKVLALDGVDDFVKVDALRDLSGSELSISYWFRGNSIQSAVRQQSGGYLVSGWNGLHILSNDGGTSGISIGEGYNDGKWHNVVMTWKQGEVGGFSSYLDGKAVAHRDSSNTPIRNHNAPVTFGSLGGVSEFADGFLDEIAIWKRALTADEVQTNWNRKLSGSETGLVGFWNFDDATATDLGPAKYEGELSNGASIQDEAIPGLGGGVGQVQLGAAGAFSIAGLPDGDGYSVTAFLDVNGNGRQDANEPLGSVAGGPFNLSGTKSGIEITLAGAPQITQQPAGARVALGASLTLNVKAEGSENLSYSWLKDDAPLSDGGAVSGAKSATLKLTNVSLSDSGVYSVVVSNAIGSATSDAAPVRVVAGGVTIGGTISYSGSQTGTLHVLAAQRKPGNKVLSLDGSGDTVATTVTDLSGSELTIQYWFKGTVMQSAVRQQSAGYIVSGWNGMHILSNDKGTSGISAGTNATDGAWHHVMVTWKQGAPGGFASYLDGKLVEKRDAANSPIPNHNAQLYFGSWNGTGEFANGMLDEIGIWNRALSPSEVAAGWSQPLRGNEAGLIGYWDFNDGAVTDRTANQNNGDLLGDAKILDEEVPRLGSIYSAEVSAGAKFSLENLPTGDNYFVSAYIDANGNGIQDENEPSGTFATTPTTLAASRNDIDFTLTEKPRITSQPSPVRAGPDESAHLSVGASGTAPLSYQWLKDGAELQDGGRITGAKAAELNVAGIQAADAGTYSVRVTNAQGSSSSRAVDLAVVSGGVSLSGEARYSGTAMGRIVLKAERFKPGNKALKLDGDGDFVRVPALTDLGGEEITIAFWFRGSSVQSAVRQQSDGYIVAGWNGLHILSNDGGTGGISAGPAVTDGNWHHVAFSWKVGAPGGFASYLDGKLVASRDSSSDPVPTLNASVYFGAFNGAGEYAKGELDEIGIWNRALTAAEVGNVARTILNGSESDLVGFWNFDDGTAKDLSPHHYDGELNGNAAIVEAQVSGLGGGAFIDELAGPGPFIMRHIPAGPNYVLSGFIDTNGDLSPNGDETVVTFGGNPFDLAGDKSRVVMEFGDTTAPSLTIERLTNALLISWPSTVQGYVLESSASLSAPIWTTVSDVVDNKLQIAAPVAAKFYRLKKN